MELTLLRDVLKRDCSLGRLSADNEFLCYTVEDAVREIPGKPVSAWKIPGKTAIPFGRYKVIITRSTRFGRDLPLLLDVPGFTGIRFHPLNLASESEGCIGPGMERTTHGVLRSREAMSLLQPLIEEAPETWITIRGL